MSGDVEDRPTFNVLEAVGRLAARQHPHPPEGPTAESLFQIEPPPSPADMAEEAGDPIPDVGDPYRVHGRVGNKPELMLGLVLRGVPLEVFSYADLRRIRVLGPKAPGDGPALVLRFVEADLTEVVIEGRNLLVLADHLRRHRIPWLRELPAGRIEDDPLAVVITRITIGPAEGP